MRIAHVAGVGLLACTPPETEGPVGPLAAYVDCVATMHVECNGNGGECARWETHYDDRGLRTESAELLYGHEVTSSAYDEHDRRVEYRQEYDGDEKWFQTWTYEGDSIYPSGSETDSGGDGKIDHRVDYTWVEKSTDRVEWVEETYWLFEGWEPQDPWRNTATLEDGTPTEIVRDKRDDGHTDILEEYVVVAGLDYSGSWSNDEGYVYTELSWTRDDVGRAVVFEQTPDRSTIEWECP